MRASIAVDGDLVTEALNLSKLKTKKQVVEIALKEFIRIKKQQKILKLEGKLKWEGNLDEMRQGRFIQ